MWGRYFQNLARIYLWVSAEEGNNVLKYIFRIKNLFFVKIELEKFEYNKIERWIIS